MPLVVVQVEEKRESLERVAEALNGAFSVDAYYGHRGGPSSPAPSAPLFSISIVSEIFLFPLRLMGYHRTSIGFFPMTRIVVLPGVAVAAPFICPQHRSPHNTISHHTAAHTHRPPFSLSTYSPASLETQHYSATCCSPHFCSTHTTHLPWRRGHPSAQEQAALRVRLHHGEGLRPRQQRL